MSRSLVLVVVAALSLPLAGCPGLTAGAGARPEGHRLVDGTLELPDDFVIGRQVSGVRMTAVAVRDDDGAPSFELFRSDVFSPDEGKAVPFALSVPAARAFHLVLETPKGSPSGPGSWLGALLFGDGRGADTSFVPAGDDDLTLAAVVAVEHGAGAADNELRGPTSHNPLGQVDSDADGQSDLLDEDDDDDQIPDGTDTDVGGDGIEDALQMLEYLADDDGDSIPDAFQ